MGDLVAFERVHLVGVGGAGMSGLAKLLAQAGHTVSGSDIKPGKATTVLPRVGVKTWIGHRPDLASSWDLVVASSAVPAKDPEVMAAREAGVEVWERPTLLAEITKRIPAIGVAGTHGKTTTTAMLVTAARALGRDPSFMVGGEVTALNTNAHLGERDLFLLEADEAFGTFLDLTLRGLVLTNVDADHLDHYETIENLETAFRDVVGKVQGPVVACLDDPGAAGVAAAVPGVIGYGTHPDASWRIVDMAHPGTSVSFGLLHDGSRYDVVVPRPGDHVALNAAGLLALLGEFGVDVATAAAGLESFGGVRRRFEVKARVGDVTVVDDYAHHPTEIGATIAAARRGDPARVVAVFQPHRYTRTDELATEFGPALAGADLVIVTDVYAAGEPPIPGVTGRLVVDAVRAAGCEVSYVPRRADLAAAVARSALPGDTVLMLGAGDITLVADEVGAILGAAGVTSLAALAEAGKLTMAVELAPMTTYKVGGAARWFLEAESEQDLIDLGAAIRETPAPVLVLGRGSNIVVSDRGFDGVVVHLGAGLAGLTIDDEGLAVAGAALPQAGLARGTAAQGRGGLEFMVGIPGSVGGAVRMNAGCWGTDTSEWLVSARVFDFVKGEVTSRDAQTMGLRYRHSDLSENEAVVAATFRTVERPRTECEEILREITRWRRDHQPGGTFNAGSVFKNPDGDYAGRIIDDLGLKGLRIGGVSVSERHANFFVAERGTAAQDVFDLVELVRNRVLAATGIVLDPEMRFAGDFGKPA